MRVKFTSLAVWLLAAVLFLVGTIGAAIEKKADGKPFKVEGALTRDDPKDRVLKNSHHKIHSFRMAAGKTYRIDLLSKQFDAYLRLVDPSGAQVAADDDGGEGTNARIIYQAAKAGEYQVIATSFEAGATGKYTLTIVQASSADVLDREAKTLNARAIALYQEGKYPEAIQLLRDVLAMRSRLYPQAKFPGGHPDLAQSLNNLGLLLQARGDLAGAELFLRDALAMYRKLYPAARFPDGHPDLATSLNNLGLLLEARGEYAQAEPYYRDALAMYRKVYPAARYPDGHLDLAVSLNNLGHLLQARGAYAQAEPCCRDALAMTRKLCPAARYPHGHPQLARSLNNLGLLLRARGEYAQGELLLSEALAMYRKLYPAARYPDGHPELASCLTSQGLLLKARGDYMQAEPYYRDALAMRRKLFPAARYPDGHHDLANSLNHVGFLLLGRGEYAEAERFFREALAMSRKLYPAARYADGHPDLATSLDNLGGLLHARKEYTEAEPLRRDVLAMRRKLYPAARYPDGHPDLAVSLNNIGGLLHDRGEYAQAEPYFRDALAMSQRLAATFADASAEAEALNYLTSQLPSLREVFLSVTANVKDSSPDTTYALLWQGKAALARALERRQRLLRRLDDVTVRDQLKELLDTRRQLAQLLLGQDRQEKGRDQRLQSLTQRKEDLEKKLAARLPEVKDAQAPGSDLVDRLAGDAAFVDFYRFRHRPRGEKEWRPHYVAFVLRKEAKVVRVELGQAEPIEKALAAWRQAIAAGLDSPGAADLRRLVWDKLVMYLPEQPGSTLYLCPDSDLSALPWAALPGRRPGTVLLEDHTLALVPHGHFLLARLRERGQASPPGPGLLLAVGGVTYDKAAAPVRRADDLTALRRADRADKHGVWIDLPSTAREAKAVADLARTRKEPPKVLVRDGTQAGPAQLLLDLPQARWAHLATHGFFAAPASEARKYLLDEKDFLRGMRGERVGVGARNPLTQTGLVLAGANLKGKAAAADGGILTAEGLAGLNLDQLELAVLSACETGLGEAASGEGVFGLQRAFHLGGCKNVVASLWKVEDDATAALMAVFYHELWVKGAPPLQALQRAQLALYHHPQDVPVLARSRGPDFDTTVRRVTQPPAAKEPRRQSRAAVKDWAAFVLSGAGN